MFFILVPVQIQKEPVTEVVLVLQDSVSSVVECEASTRLHEANIPLTKYCGNFLFSSILFIFCLYMHLIFF